LKGLELGLYRWVRGEGDGFLGQTGDQALQPLDVGEAGEVVLGGEGQRAGNSVYDLEESIYRCLLHLCP